MAAKAKLSVLGLYRYNNSIFSDMALPEEVDGEILTWRILEDCAELEVLYSDPDYMKASIYNWSSAMLPSWRKMQEALTAEYNPIWNKDGTIRETYVYGEQNASRNYGAQQETANIGAQTISNNIGARNQEETHQVSGFNSSALENATKDTTLIQAATDSQNNSARQDSTQRNAHTDTEKRDTYTDSITRIEQGNIGVTESSAMVRHEIELRSDFNIYSIIANDFKKHYCLMVY